VIVDQLGVFLEKMFFHLDECPHPFVASFEIGLAVFADILDQHPENIIEESLTDNTLLEFHKFLDKPSTGFFQLVVRKWAQRELDELLQRVEP